jgi:catechol 2,3-dioxygenase-like lactoylglutathione lyase family enzyme
MIGRSIRGSRPVLVAAEPQLFVADIQASCDFFVQKLGFKVAFVDGNPPYYAQVARDRAALNLSHVDRPVFDNERREREELLSAAIVVDTRAEIDQLHEEYRSAGVPFHRGLKDEAWGARNFIIKDPDGNLILFAGPMD